MSLSFCAAGAVYLWNQGQKTIAQNIPLSVVAAMPGLLCVFYLICTVIEGLVLGFMAKLLASTPWNVRNIVRVSYCLWIVDLPW
jgi:hypothetical protein